MFELFELNDLSSYIQFAGLFLQTATIIGLFYFLNYNFNNRTNTKPKLVRSDNKTNMRAQRLQNETNVIVVWLAHCVRRKEAPDESPLVYLLERLSIKIQGGKTCQQNQKNLYPLSLNGIYLYSVF